MAEPCRVRRADKNDIDALEGLLAEVWPDFDAVFGQSWGAFFADEKAAAFIADVEKEPCGCVLLAMGEPVIHALCVAEAHRGKAYADDLLTAAIDWARDQHPDATVLTFVGPDDSAQQARFTRMGFVQFDLAWTRTSHLVFALFPAASAAHAPEHLSEADRA